MLINNKRPSRKLWLLLAIIAAILATSPLFHQTARAQQKGKSSEASKASRQQQQKAASQHDPFEFEQQQARLMLGYNNTPPLFLTGSRNLFVDVARYPLGTKLTTIRALDIDGDPLEYSLQPANLNDASPYFSIDPIKGELRLAHKQFPFHSSSAGQNEGVRGQGEQVGGTKTTTITTKTDIESEEEEDSEYDDRGAEDGDEGEEGERPERNLYFLNVAANDGRYSSVVELLIHFINSSSLAALQASGRGLPVQLTPEGSRRASDRVDSLIRRKISESFKHARTTGNGSSTPALVYPNFVNPSIVRHSQDSSLAEQQISETATSTLSSAAAAAVTSIHPPTITQASSQYVGTHLEGSNASQQQQSRLPPRSSSAAQAIERPPESAGLGAGAGWEPMLVSLFVVCSCLMIALVLLMFVVPLSVKRLRRRLKQVESVQHEHLSQQASSLSGASSTSGSMAAHAAHVVNPSLSQFTLSSDRSCALACVGTGNSSSVCRQLSLDSSVSAMASGCSLEQRQQQQQAALHFIAPTTQMLFSRPLNRVNNGSIANPVYLNKHRQVAAAGVAPATDQFVHMNQQHQLSGSDNVNHQRLIDCQHQQQQPTAAENLYYPLDDNFYSTINTESTALDDALGVDFGLGGQQQQNYSMAHCAQPEVARADSRGSDSGSSTRSLARFLSLPARHLYHTQEQQQQQVDGETWFTTTPTSNLSQQPQNQVSKTIARSSQVERERTTTCAGGKNGNWELDRHKLKFLDILDEGQFGLVWRCKLKLDDKQEQTVAIKTLKISASRDGRGREELLAEIEIMKLVCGHPNVVKILHCCTRDSEPESFLDNNNKTTTNTNTSIVSHNKPILLVMEYVELGKLQSFLESSRLNHHYATNLYNNLQQQPQQSSSPSSPLPPPLSPTPSNDHLTSRDLIKFIYHVAKGMEYISSKCIVHRDLASRNILVSSQRICKIGDFGMARHMQSLSGVYERHSRNTKVPVRWMAPEVLLENSFTSKSDVFSFGILMWEIVTLGSTPYRHLKTEQVINEVARNGQRPIRPDYCHPQLYKIMSMCWLQQPEQRPTFRELVEKLDELLMSADDYIKLDEYPDHDYYNIPKTSAPYELL